MLLYARVIVSCNNIKYPAQLAQWKKPLGVMHTVKRIHSQLVFFEQERARRVSDMVLPSSLPSLSRYDPIVPAWNEIRIALLSEPTQGCDQTT